MRSTSIHFDSCGNRDIRATEVSVKHFVHVPATAIELTSEQDARDVAEVLQLVLRSGQYLIGAEEGYHPVVRLADVTTDRRPA